LSVRRVSTNRQGSDDQGDRRSRRTVGGGQALLFIRTSRHDLIVEQTVEPNEFNVNIFDPERIALLSESDALQWPLPGEREARKSGPIFRTPWPVQIFPERMALFVSAGDTLILED
jgi:hypothetical protein